MEKEGECIQEGIRTLKEIGEGLRQRLENGKERRRIQDNT
jgi:hypothetical protein